MSNYFKQQLSYTVYRILKGHNLITSPAYTFFYLIDILQGGCRRFCAAHIPLFGYQSIYFSGI